MTQQITRPIRLDNLAVPEWATDMLGVEGGGTPWFSRKIGTTYSTPGASTEVPRIPDDTDEVSFELFSDHDPETGVQRGVYIYQGGSLDASYRSTDAMRNYARVLLDVADQADAILGRA